MGGDWPCRRLRPTWPGPARGPGTRGPPTDPDRPTGSASPRAGLSSGQCPPSHRVPTASAGAGPPLARSIPCWRKQASRSSDKSPGRSWVLGRCQRRPRRRPQWRWPPRQRPHLGYRGKLSDLFPAHPAAIAASRCELGVAIENLLGLLDRLAVICHGPQHPGHRLFFERCGMQQRAISTAV